MTPSLARRLTAEAVGTALLLAAIVGSGVMAERLSAGNGGLALLANAIATGSALYVLIGTLGPVSGAHFNPLVTAAAAVKRELPAAEALAYASVQIGAAVAGVVLAHAMFALPLLQIGGIARAGWPIVLSEAAATAGLVLVVRGARGIDRAAAGVALYITAAYWFTASTSFANPAVTLARALTDTFAGVAPYDTVPMIAGQIGGTATALVLSGWLFERRGRNPSTERQPEP